MSAESVRVRLEPLSVEVEAPRGASLVSSLSDHGVEFPCGGTGICGGCGVRVLAGSLPITDADREAFTVEQLEAGWRLACQAQA
ncbi:MAG: 2Fe-2S iron-sulfur cluster binding domain-containing protein, partial [Acidobacteriota bacterium]|nr:2Fe-2S iron-sulfur cluster binding domain-containing protein [Acidobacteriota bacterium]